MRKQVVGRPLGMAPVTRLPFHPLSGLMLPRQAGWQGCCVMESSLNGRMLVDMERRGQPSKWLTLKALRVLKGAYG